MRVALLAILLLTGCKGYEDINSGDITKICLDKGGIIALQYTLGGGLTITCRTGSRYRAQL